jgi:hypothetical protein
MAHTPKESRHSFRGLRHKLEGSPSEILQYEREVAAHLEQDKHEEVMNAATSGLATAKTPAKKS